MPLLLLLIASMCAGALIQIWVSSVSFGIMPDKSLTKIRFGTFLSFYRLAPDSWVLNKKTVEKVVYDGCYRPKRTEYRFGFIETFKYMRWAKKEKARKQYEKDMSFLIDSVNADLEAYRKKTEAEVEIEIDKIVKSRMDKMKRYGIQPVIDAKIKVTKEN